MKECYKINHLGSRYTKSYFKDDNKNTIIVNTWIDSGIYGHNSLCVFKHSISVINYRCRKEEFKYCSETTLDDRYKEFITEQQLYESYHNHWNKINPFRLFSNGSINSDLIFNGEVEQIKPDIDHKLY